MIKFSLELDMQKIDNKRYFRCAPVIESTGNTKNAIVAFIFLLFLGATLLVIQAVQASPQTPIAHHEWKADNE